MTHTQELKQIRSDLSLTQQAFADRLNITQGRYAYFERGKKDVPESLMIAARAILQDARKEEDIEAFREATGQTEEEKQDEEERLVEAYHKLVEVANRYVSLYKLSEDFLDYVIDQKYNALLGMARGKPNRYQLSAWVNKVVRRALISYRSSPSAGIRSRSSVDDVCEYKITSPADIIADMDSRDRFQQVVQYIGAQRGSRGKDLEMVMQHAAGYKMREIAEKAGYNTRPSGGAISIRVKRGRKHLQEVFSEKKQA